MSYLDVPRLHFSGRFQADPPTVNNDPDHYDDNRFLARYQLPTDPTDANGWWNPNGSGAFRLRDCTVTAAVASGGPLAQDALVGGMLTDARQRVSAKIVDL